MWLDTHLHQAMGLHSFTPEQQLRLLTVISQPDANAAGLETLWELCASLQRLSYPVVVLDGTAAESDHAPGLSHLLSGMPWPGAGAAPGAALAVLPAARGLVNLARHASAAAGLAPLAPLAPLFRSYGIAVLYAPAELLAPLLQAAAGHFVPLVMTGPGAHGLVGSYRQLKHLALHAGVRSCTVASLGTPGNPQQTRQTAEALGTLQRSAREHLGLQAHTTQVAPGRAQDIQRLALQLLENACTMDTAGAALHSIGPAASVHFLDRSH